MDVISKDKKKKNENKKHYREYTKMERQKGLPFRKSTNNVWF